MTKEAKPGQKPSLLILSRAQRSVGKREWQTTAQGEQERALREANQQKSWYSIEAVAHEWRAGGQDHKAQTLGQRLIKLWQAQPRKTKRREFAHALASCGLFDQALQQLFPHSEMDARTWDSEVRNLAEEWRAASPKPLLRLAPIPRHEALLAWAAGVASPESPASNYLGGTHSTTPTFDMGSKRPSRSST